MSSSIESKSDIQARPEHLQQFGLSLRAAKPKGPVSGVVALGFNVRQTPAEGLELATAFLGSVLNNPACSARDKTVIRQ